MRTRVFFCGFSRLVVVLAVACAGVVAFGLVFYVKSPCAVTGAEAQAVVRMLPPFVTTVGLFVDAAHTEIHEVLQAVPLAMLQFHGNESPSNCRLYGRPYVKAVRMREDADLAAVARSYDDAAGILVDTYVEGVPGGTGRAFDWSRLPSNLSRPLILAGGLTPASIK